MHDSFASEITFTSSCGFDTLFSDRLTQLQDAIEVITENVLTVSPSVIELRLQYRTPDDLVAQRINMPEKGFRIERRGKIDDGNTYLSVSPTSSSEHDRLLALVEAQS